MNTPDNTSPYEDCLKAVASAMQTAFAFNPLAPIFASTAKGAALNATQTRERFDKEVRAQLVRKGYEITAITVEEHCVVVKVVSHEVPISCSFSADVLRIAIGMERRVARNRANCDTRPGHSYGIEAVARR